MQINEEKSALLSLEIMEIKLSMILSLIMSIHGLPPAAECESCARYAGPRPQVPQKTESLPALGAYLGGGTWQRGGGALWSTHLSVFLRSNMS